MSNSFEKAAKCYDTIINSKDGKILSDESKLRLYALYKQAQFGDVNVSEPSFLNPLKRQKWAAWKSLRGKMNQGQAKVQYITEVEKIMSLINK